MKTLIALDEKRDRLRVKTLIAFRENPQNTHKMFLSEEYWF
jgi:hypothetical protein